MSKIIQNLFLGEAMDANNKKLLDELKITHILIVAKELPEFQSQGYEYLKINAADSLKFDMKSYFNEMNEFIDKGRKKGSVLVHCMFGVSRSATAVIAYLIYLKKMSFKQAFNFVSSKRPIQPNDSFIKQLIEYAESFRRKDDFNDGKSLPITSLNKRNSQSPTNKRLFMKNNGNPSPIINRMITTIAKNAPVLKKVPSRTQQKFMEKPFQKDSSFARYERSVESAFKRKSEQVTLTKNKVKIPKVEPKVEQVMDLYAKQGSDNQIKTFKTSINLIKNFQKNQNNYKQIWNLPKNKFEKVESVAENNIYRNFMIENEKRVNYRFFCSNCDFPLFAFQDLMSHSRGMQKENDKCLYLFLKNLSFFTPKKDAFQCFEIKCPKCENSLGNYQNGGMICSCGVYVQFSHRIAKKSTKMIAQ